MLLEIVVPKMHGKKVYLSPQSIGPIRSKLLKYLVSRNSDGCDAICLREPISMEFVQEELHVPKAKFLRMSDLAFFHDFSDKMLAQEILENEFGIRPGEPFIAATVVRWNFPHHRDPAALRKRYLHAMARALSQAAERYDTKVLMLNQVSDDLPDARVVKEIVGERLIIDAEDRSPAVMRPVFVCHAVRYFALSFVHLLTSEGTPSIAIS